MQHVVYIAESHIHSHKHECAALKIAAEEVRAADRTGDYYECGGQENKIKILIL
jgi:elongation factor P hydroxylase